MKSHWIADQNSVRLTMPIAKIDKENRRVSGFATLDNIDQADEVVTAEASKEAFKRFKGNIREMHEPIAAGRLVDFREDSFFDKKTNQFYSGIYVTVYVSKGAQPTWEKVLDGTLSGFSIGGSIIDQETQFVKDAGEDGRGKTVRFIKAYELGELSLVDAPCNQYANIFAITKRQGVAFMKGMATDIHLVNVFWCGTDEIAKNSTEETENCNACGSEMELIGWVEKSSDLTQAVADTVTKFLRHKGEDAEPVKASGEGGVEMANEELEKSVITSGDVGGDEGADKAAEVEEVETENVETDEAAEVEEAPAEADFEKLFDDLKDSVNDSLVKSKEAVEKTVADFEKRVSEVTKTFDEKASEFEKKMEELSKNLDGIRSGSDSVEKRLNALEKATAIKKSGEVETEPEKKLQKRLWSGTFLNDD